ncbi:MAG TPA: AAA family ATPase [Candidatus Binatia bacterium]|nr:AAA family ATPase [Candidatus Binatia bacterium]
MSSTCESCGTRIHSGSKFCIRCGAPFQTSCDRCGFKNLPAATFCAECGVSLSSSLKITPEFRQLTVLFCDLVGSTQLAERKDPEDLRDLILAYQNCCSHVIERFGGYVGQFLGDGVLAYFGYPVAYEHDARRAVEASLCMIEEVRDLSVQGEILETRIGIHTGIVVIGAGRAAGQDDQAIGEAPSLAARLQSEAEPNTVLISDTTARLVRGTFELKKLRPRRLKGFSREMAVYQVRRSREGYSYSDLVAIFELTPFVGRSKELEIAKMHWRSACAGKRQLIHVVGEPGIGKSRLIRVLRDEVSESGCVVLECRCSPYYQNSALHPFIELLQREVGFSRADSKETKYIKLKHWLERFPLSHGEVLPVFGVLLNISDGRGLSNMTPQKERELTLQALSSLLTARANQSPTLFILEDLHWADPSTLELMEKLVQLQDPSPILLVLSHRPEFEVPLVGCSSLSHLELRRLTPDQSKTIVTHAAGKDLPHEVVEEVIARAEGVPLFIEEITKAIVESGALKEMADSYELTGPIPQSLIPTTVLESLMARLDRLGFALPLAQIGAAIGREFGYELLEAVSLQSKDELHQALNKLQDAQLVFRLSDSPEPVFVFKHALVRETAYKSLLRGKRYEIHDRIARVLEKQFPEIAETHPELLAHHFQEAGLTSEAIAYWERAGQRAIEHSANNEAIRHFKQGLELLKTLPDDSQRLQRELMLQSALGAPLVMTKGYGAPEVQSAYARARELCQQIGETQQLFTALRGLWVFYLVRADYRTAHELGTQLLNIAEAEQDPALIMEAHMTVGIPMFYLRQLTHARTHLAQSLALYNPQQHRVHAFRYGQDPGIAAAGFDAWALCLLGYPSQGRKLMDETLKLAETQAHPFSLAYALHFASIVHRLCREPQLTEERAEAEIALSKEQGFPLFVAGGTAFKGWALVAKGEIEEGLSLMRWGIDAWQKTGAELARSYWLILLAETYEQTGRIEDGLSTVAQAFSAMNKNSEYFYESEVYRVKGDLLLHSHSTEREAEICFRHSIDVARRQGMKLFELRAVSSLSRFLKENGKGPEALQLLREVHGGFSEGFDMPDLADAEMILNTLS